LWRSGDHALALDAVRVGPSTPSLRAQRSNPSHRAKKGWIASSQVLLAMTTNT
jgi:hypothetical protein